MLPSTTVLVGGSLVSKDPLEVLVYTFDWDSAANPENVALGATITTSTFTVTAIHPAGDVALVLDQASILTGNRKTQVRATGGTLGALYLIRNQVVTTEAPTETKERSVQVLLENK